MHAAVRGLVRSYAEPLVASRTPEAVQKALHTTPSYADAMDSLCDWITSTPRALESLLVPMPVGAYPLDYTTLDLYMVPRLIGALSVLCTHVQQASNTTETAMQYSGALLHAMKEAAGATMRVIGTVLHVCLSSTHQHSHVRFLLYDALRAGARMVSLRIPNTWHMHTLSMPGTLRDKATPGQLVLGSHDPVPLSMALSTPSHVPVAVRAPGTPAYAWSAADAALFVIPVDEVFGPALADHLVMLSTRIASELALVFPSAMQDIVECATYATLACLPDLPEHLTLLQAEAMQAAIRVLPDSFSFFHLVRVCGTSLAFHSMEEAVCTCLYDVLGHARSTLCACRAREKALPPEVYGILGDARALLPTLLHQAQQHQGIWRQCYAAQLGLALSLLDSDPWTDEEWRQVDELDESALMEECTRLHTSPRRRSPSPSLCVQHHGARKRARIDAPTIPCPSDPCTYCDSADLDMSNPAPWTITTLDELPDVWSHVTFSDPHQAMPCLQDMLRMTMHAAPDVLVQCPFDTWLGLLRSALMHVHRGVRIRAGRLLYVMVSRFASAPLHSAARLAALVQLATDGTKSSDRKIQETSLSTVALLGRIQNDASFVLVVTALIHGLYLPHIYLRALASAETIQLALYRKCTTFQLLSQHLDTVCHVALSAHIGAMQALGELARLVGMNVPTFLQTTLDYTLPLLLEQHAHHMGHAQSHIEALATTVGQPVPGLCLSHVSAVFQHVYLLPPDVRDASVQAFLSLLGTRSVTVASLLRSRLHDVLGWLVMHLGSPTTHEVEAALQGLECVRSTMATSGKWRGMNLTSFLQEEVLAILTWINDELSGVHGKMRIARQAMAVRSIGALVQQIGAVAARVAPQVLASLTSTLQKPGLAMPTLESWYHVVQALRGADLGSVVGPTAAALLHVWPTLDVEERRMGGQVLRCAILERTTDPSFLNDVPSLDALDEDVPDVAQRIRATRRVWDDEAYFRHILERVANDSAAICLQSLHELRTFLQERRACIAIWTTGNVFHALIGQCIRVLMAVASRTEWGEHVQRVCLACLGLLGAVDPDRLEMPPEEPIFVLLSDFDQADESLTLAQRLLVELVVPAFRATNDTKHQAALAYAIQELLKFCHFTPALLEANAPSRVPDKVRRRWAALPEAMLPTLLPLLNSRYVVQHTEPRPRTTPLYLHSVSYRDWIQAWALLLIRQAREGDAATLFGVFISVVRDHDVGVAQYLLPHLVLHTLISGTEAQRRGVLDEFRAVLADQASPTQGYDPERRRLTAQALFTVLDHVGHWMRRMRLVPPRAAKRSRLRDALQDVQAIMDELSPDLLAQASLQCDAYARALLHFEYRIRAVRQQQSSDTLQSYYETMHEIYASLDDPDGMEGISTKVLSPSLEHQIREHESTGRWTDAQSCWEVELQRRPDDVRLHVGLLRCLRNLGHYDTLRTHIRGVLAVHPTWQAQLAPFQIEGACIMADWDAVRALVQQGHAVPELGMARALLAIREQDTRALGEAVEEARSQLGRHLLGPARVSYTQAYDAVSQLHMLCELELIFHDQHNASLPGTLASRFHATLPSFRTREPILSLRRSALQASHASASELGDCWILSAKTARKAGHTQTAYSAVLQAMQCDAPYAFMQKAKLLADSDQVQAALQVLNNALQSSEAQASQDKHALAQAHLLRARLVEETARFQQNDIIQHYKTCTSLDPDSEKIWYYLGHFYDAPGGGPVGNQMLLQLSVCRFYMKSAQHGTKFLYRTLPRMLTIWLDAGNELADSDTKAEDDSKQAQQQFDKINDMMLKSVRHLARYQWFAVLPQLVARIVHKNEAVWQVLLEIIVAVVVAYPQQGVWALIAGSHSKDKRRKQRYERIMERISSVPERAYRDVVPIIEAAERVSTELLHLCEFHVHKEATLSMQRHFPALIAAVQTTPLILPLQSSVNVNLPPDNHVHTDHRPFPRNLPTIQGFDDTIEIMHSLQKPRKVVIHASDGHKYPFLCKPRDDLRKDARLMEFDSMINKLLQSNSESRRRRLYIRTYAVIILNEECGLIEWVPNTIAYRQILTKHYAALDIPMYTSDLKTLLDEARANPKNAAQIFDTKVVSRYPPVFHAWFLETFPEPSAWFKARSAYARTAAVMSIVGFVLGLGDRHGDNILFDAGSGDTVHVDLNCLFEKGMTFEIPERVPFRLTHNMVDALGVAGVEGAFRRTAEITMGILRDNKESLMSVLQAMVHDPLGEWVATERRARHRHGDKTASTAAAGAGARKALKSVSDKLDGRLRRPGLSDEVRHTTKNLVHMLICDATSSQNLGQMYVGWAPYL